VAGTTHSAPVGQIADWCTDYFTRFPAGAKPGLRHLGKRDWHFLWVEGTRHRLPAALARLAGRLTGNARLARQAARLGDVLVYLNSAFHHFMHRTYDFRPSWPVQERGFTAERYLRTVFRGVSQHLLDVDASALAIGGREAKHIVADGPWALRGPGNGTIRLLGYGLRKVFRRVHSAVSVDMASFDAAMAMAGSGARLVVVPSHRSYFDFLILPYLFFSHPELGIGMPHIAATDAFARIPLVGRVLKAAQAFYIRRGVGSADPAVSRQVNDLLADGQVLKFFIEGTRSRSRRYLPARRGLLRAIQGTGHPVTILPVAVSYDRVPEERSILAEIRGDRKSPGGLGAMVRWVGNMARGRVRLGRVHVACGLPQILDPGTDVPALAERVIRELQRHTVVTTYHLDLFTGAQPELGWTAAQLQAALTARGARVLPGLALKAGEAVDPLLLRSLEQQWLPWFFPDLQAWMPDHPVVRHQVASFGLGMAGTAGTPPDEATQRLLTALFAPICRDYAAVARYLAERSGERAVWTLQTLHVALPQVFRPDLEAVQADLTARQILVASAGEYRWGPQAAEIGAYAAGCAWPSAVLVR
jgi:1-acyl-sn-glycerol-3-phosphate acyltransferase